MELLDETQLYLPVIIIPSFDSAIKFKVKIITGHRS